MSYRIVSISTILFWKISYQYRIGWEKPISTQLYTILRCCGDWKKHDFFPQQIRFFVFFCFFFMVFKVWIWIVQPGKLWKVEILHVLSLFNIRYIFNAYMWYIIKARVVIRLCSGTISTSSQMTQCRIIPLFTTNHRALYLFTIELNLRDDFRCFRSKMCFRTFSTVPLNSPIIGYCKLVD